VTGIDPDCPTGFARIEPANHLIKKALYQELQRSIEVAAISGHSPDKKKPGIKPGSSRYAKRI
jgi:hypothetical protein